jgi:hypothetical protein
MERLLQNSWVCASRRNLSEEIVSMDFFSKPDKTSPDYFIWKMESSIYCFGGPGDSGDSGGADTQDEQMNELDAISADFDNMSAQQAAGESVTSGSDGGVGRGGSSNDNDGDGIPNSIDRTPGVDRSSIGSSNPSSSNFNAFNASKGYVSNAVNNFSNVVEAGESDRVNQILREKGYTNLSKGTNAVSKSGNPVRSGSYEAALENARRQDAFETASREAAQAFMNKVTAQGTPYRADYMGTRLPPTVPTGLYNKAKGLTEDGIEDGNYTAEELAGFQTELGMALAKEGAFSNFSTFEDPYGLAELGYQVTPNGALLGSSVPQSDFNALSSGFNQATGPFGTNLEVDARGNIGTSTLGMRVGDFAMNSLTPFGMVADFNKINQYGSTVPGYSNVITTAQISPLGLASNQIGSMLGDQAAMAAAKGIYENTQNVDAAVGGAVASGIAAGVGAENLSKSFGQSLGLDGMDMTFEGRNQYGPDNRSLSLSIDEVMNPDGPRDSNNEDMSMQPPNQEVVDDVDQSPIVNPIVNPDQESPQDQQQQVIEQIYRQRGTPVDLSGNTQAGQNINPVFSAQPSDDITYLTRGRQRDYGKTTYSVATPVQQYRSRRGGSLRRRSGGYGDRIIV